MPINCNLRQLYTIFKSTYDPNSKIQEEFHFDYNRIEESIAIDQPLLRRVNRLT